MNASRQVASFIARVETFLVETGMSERRFGKLVKNDGSFVQRLRQGVEPRLSTIDQVDAFMHAHRARLVPAPGGGTSRVA